MLQCEIPATKTRTNPVRLISLDPTGLKFRRWPTDSSISVLLLMKKYHGAECSIPPPDAPSVAFLTEAPSSLALVAAASESWREVVDEFCELGPPRAVL